MSQVDMVGGSASIGAQRLLNDDLHGWFPSPGRWMLQMHLVVVGK